MKPFSLFKTTSVAHHYWSKILQPGDKVIDATCGNGYDTRTLALLALTEQAGFLWAIDIQEEAINQTKKLLSESLSEKICSRIKYVQGSHATFPTEIENNSIALITYNLGYLPQGKKEVTTLTETTIKSIFSALPLIKDRGVISITCYPGHEEGKREEAALLKELSSLSKDQWSCCYHQWINHDEAPSLILIQKR